MFVGFRCAVVRIQACEGVWIRRASCGCEGLIGTRAVGDGNGKGYESEKGLEMGSRDSHTVCLCTLCDNGLRIMIIAAFNAVPCLTQRLREQSEGQCH